ncbi:hypothetical protein AT246_07135 [Bartonella henselae]|uniref:hypothetical protein n=1 Tax=Bartonella henselae TaxID=38323 RepID=UPI0003DF9635|nr:hypothetical protein [Bartonella henselae]ETS10914.1 hypothetical protein Q653_00479 [Bartonella henselae JK 42]ETS12993.1 hypothetical protein Q652_00613 [Bartonella henselae JK 41]KEC59557.1 hypothetical protein O97_00086 [Bartonella henselae str. Zeus]MDM9984054.1 hypothetical protein [Bartonella henselae]MDM9985329.1 hypothetical protein [Bartonella henselae]
MDASKQEGGRVLFNCLEKRKLGGVNTSIGGGYAWEKGAGVRSDDGIGGSIGALRGLMCVLCKVRACFGWKAGIGEQGYRVWFSWCG